jgi:hypothetical protein
MPFETLCEMFQASVVREGDRPVAPAMVPNRDVHGVDTALLHACAVLCPGS